MEFHGAQWIKAGGGCEAPLIRREFNLNGPAEGSIAICGLGFFELYLNGRRVSDDVLTPVWSDYEPRRNRRLLYPLDDTFTHRIYYRVYDVGAYLVPGRNVLGVMLGNGWFHQHERVIEGDLWYRQPMLLYCLQAGEQTFVSGERETWAPGEVTFNNVYFGEEQDLRLAKPDWACGHEIGTDWRPVERAEAPQARLQEQTCPPDRRVRFLQPRLISRQGERRLFDAGENIAGWAVLETKGEAGARVTVRYAEELRDGQLDFDSAGGPEQIQHDSYILDGTARTLEPHFTWHGFRYFEVEGPLEGCRCAVVHTDVPVTAGFRCAHDTLNWLFDAYVRTQLDNIHCGVPSDCPHRERLGYTGDGQLTADACMTMLGARELYEKWMQDIADCQDPVTGHVQHTAPFYGGGGGPGGWGSAIVIVPYRYYQHYGEAEALRRYAPHMHEWVGYMASRMEDGLVVREEEGGWCLGEWCAPDPVALPEPFVNTYYLVKCLLILREIAPLTGEAWAYQQLLDDAIRGLNAYFDPATGSFCAGVQGADAFAVDLGLGDGRTLANLVARYRNGGLDTGMFGTDVLLGVLFANGYGSLAFRLLTDPDAPASYERMRAAGATTIWEDWDGHSSHNHPMQGAAARYLFQYLLGIRQRPGTAGFRDLVIAPCFVPELSWAEGTQKTVAGRVRVRYRWEGAEIDLCVALEGEARAVLAMPGKELPIRPGENHWRLPVC